jgi:hypothetical protein
MLRRNRVPNALKDITPPPSYSFRVILVPILGGMLSYIFLCFTKIVVIVSCNEPFR